MRTFRNFAGAISVAVSMLAANQVSAQDNGAVEYVKVCSLYGAGFYYIPGSDVCLRIGGYVQVGYRNTDTDFIVPDGFNVSADGWTAGVGGQALGYTRNGFVVGAEGTWNFGHVNGQNIYVGNGLLHSVRAGSSYSLEGIFGVQIPSPVIIPSSNWQHRDVRPPAFIAMTIGPAWGNFSINATGIPGETKTVSGWTVGGLYDQPLDRYWSAGLKVQYTKYNSTNFNLGGAVDTNTDVWSAVFRIQRNFSP